MARLPYNATKTNLLSLMKELKFAKEGHKLLDEKKNVLIEQIKKVLKKYNKKEKELIETFNKFNELGTKTLSIMTDIKISTLINSLKQQGELKVTHYTFMNIIIPALTNIAENYDYSISSTPAIYDELILIAKEYFNKLLELAELETGLKKFLEELKKTMRRVNALENIFIPNYSETIKYIDETLEEIEREEMYVQKLVKEKFYE